MYYPSHHEILYLLLHGKKVLMIHKKQKTKSKSKRERDVSLSSWDRSAVVIVSCVMFIYVFYLTHLIKTK